MRTKRRQDTDKTQCFKEPPKKKVLPIARGQLRVSTYLWNKEIISILWVQGSSKQQVHMFFLLKILFLFNYYFLLQKCYNIFFQLLFFVLNV